MGIAFVTVSVLGVVHLVTVSDVYHEGVAANTIACQGSANAGTERAKAKAKEGRQRGSGQEAESAQ